MKNLNYLLFVTMLLGLFMVGACGGDDEPGGGETGDAPIASFQFEYDANDFTKVTFSNFSQNADSSAWDFGDGNTSTEESPTHSYATSGDFDVQLTVTNTVGSRSTTKTVTITDPNSAIKDVTGETSKVWKLSRNVAEEEYPMLVGPADKSTVWWAYGLNDPIGSRECLMEEEYIFNIDGTFTYNTNGLVFADYGIWNADVEGQCIDDSDGALMVGPAGEDLTAWGGGDFSFTYDASGAALTVTGLGAHVGLPKVSTNGEVSTPQESVTYTVTSLTTDGPVDKMVLETGNADLYWQFILVSYDNPADEPELPGAPPTAAFTTVIDGSTATFNNSSVNADSYEWDFGDGNMSTEESPMHTYGSDGAYTVTMTATNANGSSQSTANIVISNNSVFSASTVHGDGTKTWKMSPTPGSISVGPGIGSTEWFSISQEGVDARACFYDDEYVFDTNGAFNFVTGDEIWAEEYMGVDPPACVTEDMLSEDVAAWGAGEHTYTITEATESTPAYITVTGTGAYIALPKVYNGGEYAGGPPPTDASVTYQVLSYINEGSKETLVLTIDISEGEAGGAYWTYTLVSE